MDHYVCIVDGEVAFVIPKFRVTEKSGAALLSNPTFVLTSEEVAEGYLYDGTNFTPPTA